MRCSTNRSSGLDAMSQHQAALIFQIGAVFVRVGVAGETHPRHVLPIIAQNNDAGDCSIEQDSSYHDVDQPYFASHNHGLKHKKEWEEYLTPLMSTIYFHRLLMDPKSRRVLIIISPHQPSAFIEALYSVLSLTYSVPSVMIVENGTLTCIPAALGMTQALVIDIGHIEARVGCVYQYEQCCHHILMEDTLNVVPCGYQSFVRFVIHCWNNSDAAVKCSREFSVKTNQTEEFTDGMQIIKSFLCHIDKTEDISLNQKNMYPSFIEECLCNFYFDASNPNSLVHAFLKTLVSCPIDLRCSMAKNVVIVGGGMIPLVNFEIERRLIECIQNIYKNSPRNSNVLIRKTGSSPIFSSITCSRFSCLAPVLFPSKENRELLPILCPLPFLPSSMSWIGASIRSVLSKDKDTMRYVHENKRGTSI